MRPRSLYKNSIQLVGIVFAMLLGANTAFAQTTSFTYQGRLTDGGTAANGNYDLQFALFDSASGGTQIGATQTSPNVLVSAGIFTVQLDFGANAFPGAPRFLEISARLTGTASFTTLSPRQPITSTPYAVRSLNASSADAVTVSGVPGGSGNYIQNNPPSQQPGANFNISGNGSAGGTLSGDVVNAGTEFRIRGTPFLTTENNSTFAGVGAGRIGFNNTFFGTSAGEANGGAAAANSYFGSSAGVANTTGEANSFFGYSSGSLNTGSRNTFVGFFTGIEQRTGTHNTLIGSGADVVSGNLSNATAIGAFAQVDQSNSMVLGSVAGINGASASVNVGIGTTAPTAKLDIRANSALIRLGGVDCGPNFGAITFGNVALGCNNYSLLGEGVNTFINRPTGGVITFRENNNTQMQIQSGGSVVFNGLVKLNQIESGLGEGTVHLCRNGAGNIATCTSSSLRYKQQIAPFSGGLDLIRRLRPISFTWKIDGSRDLGLGAEDVAKIEPLLVTHNDKGEIEGVKYDHLNVILINAIKEQQAQIETLRTSNAALQSRLSAVEKVLRKRVGSSRRRR